MICKDKKEKLMCGCMVLAVLWVVWLERRSLKTTLVWRLSSYGEKFVFGQLSERLSPEI